MKRGGRGSQPLIGAETQAIGSKIVSLRQGRSLSRRDLAQQAGVSYSYLSAIESGKRWPTPAALGKISSVFGRRALQLIGEADALVPPAWVGKSSPVTATPPVSSSGAPMLHSRTSTRVPMSEAGWMRPPAGRIHAMGGRSFGPPEPLSHSSFSMFTASSGESALLGGEVPGAPVNVSAAEDESATLNEIWRLAARLDPEQRRFIAQMLRGMADRT